MSRSGKDVLQGTLEMLILRALQPGPLHGYGIVKRIQQVSDDTLRVEEGSLYPALHRLEQEHWIRAEWKPSETGRRAKFYGLTEAGEKRLAEEQENWRKLTRAVGRVLRFA